MSWPVLPGNRILMILVDLDNKHVAMTGRNYLKPRKIINQEETL